MSTPAHDRAIPIPTNETQNDGVNNAELPRECGYSEEEREKPEPNDESALPQLAKTTIEKLTKNWGSVEESCSYFRQKSAGLR